MMKRIFSIMLLLGVCFSAGAQQLKTVTAKELMTQYSADDTVYIINFWATWCGPCVKELPAFNELEQRFQGKPVKV
ncbi:MAG: TlpA family protein disulfide reductase, partial [Sphingobacteriales bacterium]